MSAFRLLGATMMHMSSVNSAVLSPCIGLCVLDHEGFCQGCYRTGDEIAAWLALSHDMREQMMDVILPARAATREAAQ